MSPASDRTLATRDLRLEVTSGAAVLPLLREVWGDERDVVGEYPLLFADDGRDDAAAGAFVRLAVDGESVAACGVLERELVTPFGELRVALLGSVATAPAWRGRGFAAHVLAGAEEVARASNCVAALLWPMDGRVYRGSGYRPASCEWNVVLPPDLELGRATALLRGGPTDAAALLELYDRHPVRVRRTVREFARLLACPGMEVRVATDGTRPVAYACLGRGGDLATCVHEWAGEPDAVLALVSSFARESAGGDATRYLIAPDWTSRVTEALLDAGCAAVTRPLGMAKLVDREAACRFVARRTGRDVAPTPCGALVATESGPRGLSDAQLLAAILPAENRGAALESAADALAVHPADLPAYAFCWGLDSI